MTRTSPVLLALALGLAAATALVAPPASADDPAPAAASLEVSPAEHYVGGQGLHWTGEVGVAGVQTITMQRHLGRPGDEWEDVEHFSDQTDASGAFAYWYPAPAMRGITYRVVAEGGQTTPGVELEAVQPDLVLWVTGDDRDDPDDIGQAVAGEPFGISVDTTPRLFRRPDTVGLQPIPGRVLTLQRRVEGRGDRWDRLGTALVGDDGMGYFTGVVEDEPGEVVYRVRQEDWTEGHDQIGWFPSFPTYVTVSSAGADPVRAAGSAGMAAPEPEDRVAGPDAGGSAAQRYRWFPARYDFAWVLGESLTSPPWRGTTRKGWWADFTDGGGRVSKDGGGLVLDSKRENRAGPGDFGTTMATLHENPITYGRWESKLWVRAMEADSEDYTIRFELVPDEAPGDRCRTITVAELTDHGDTVRFGVHAGKRQWTGSRVVGEVDDRAMAFAAEVARNHITWFVDAEPVGTVTDRKAVPGVPLTMRISMIGKGTEERNRTELKSDWQRGFTLDRGEQVTSGAPLDESRLRRC